LNFRKGTLLQANSIYLAEGQWNPAAYDDAKRRGEAMTHALDNTHVDAVPEEFTGGPAINAWESQSSPDRPHIPGVVDSIPPRTTSETTSGSMPVPECSVGRTTTDDTTAGISSDTGTGSNEIPPQQPRTKFRPTRPGCLQILRPGLFRGRFTTRQDRAGSNGPLKRSSESHVEHRQGVAVILS
jgi:hypothetical protein